MTEEKPQRTPGRTTPCCICLRWAIVTGYIKEGYLWWKGTERIWIPWTIRMKAEGFIETSPIHFCPFCGTNLDKPED